MSRPPLTTARLSKRTDGVCWMRVPADAILRAQLKLDKGINFEWSCPTPGQILFTKTTDLLSKEESVTEKFKDNKNHPIFIKIQDIDAKIKLREKELNEDPFAREELEDGQTFEELGLKWREVFGNPDEKGNLEAKIVDLATLKQQHAFLLQQASELRLGPKKMPKKIKEKEEKIGYKTQKPKEVRSGSGPSLHH